MRQHHKPTAIAKQTRIPSVDENMEPTGTPWDCMRMYETVWECWDCMSSMRTGTPWECIPDDPAILLLSIHSVEIYLCVTDRHVKE